MKRVLHLLPDLEEGGGPRLILSWIERSRHAGYEPTVGHLLPAAGLAAEYAALGAETVLLSHDPAHPAQTVRTIRRYLAAHRIDVLHTHATIDKLYGHVAAMLARVPVVSHLHAMPAEQAIDPGRLAPGAGPRTRRAQLRRHATGRLRRLEDRLAVAVCVAVSEPVAAAFVTRGYRPVVVVPNGIDTGRYHPAPSPTPERRRTVLHVGRLAGAKRQDLLVDAFAEIAPGRTDVDLVIAGDGPLRPRLVEQVARLGLEDRVVFLGRIGDVVPVLQRADVFAFPSRNEGFGLALAEAMACGVPVVAARLPALAEIVVDGECGLLVPPNDAGALAAALASILDDPVTARRLAAAGRQRIVDRFSLDTQVEALTRIYDQVTRPPAKS